MPLPSYTQSTSLSILASDPIYYSTRTFSERLTAQVSSYSHETRAIGGYWSASFNINDRPNNIEDWIQYGLGRHIEVYNPALEIIWEGFVNHVSAQLGPLDFEIGPMMSVGNRTRITFSTIDTSVDPPLPGIRETTDPDNNTDSQDRYGIQEKRYSINAATLTQADQLNDLFVNDPTRAFPATSRDTSLSGESGPSAKISCLGYWHWLDQYYYSATGTGTSNISSVVQDILSNDPNSIFSTDYTRIDSNTTQTKTAYDGLETAETVMKRMISLGDWPGLNTYQAGFYGGRRFEYGIIPTEVRYQVRVGSNIIITDQLDGNVRPWDVRAAQWIFYPDFLIGRPLPFNATSLSRDPRAGYAENVKYSIPTDLDIDGVKLSQLDQALARRGMGGVA